MTVPCNVTCCGLSELLSANFKVPSCLPTVLEVNEMLIEHDPAGARLEAQSFVSVKGPVVETPVMESAVAPVFVNVTLWVGGGQG